MTNILSDFRIDRLILLSKQEYPPTDIIHDILANLKQARIQLKSNQETTDIVGRHYRNDIEKLFTEQQMSIQQAHEYELKLKQIQAEYDKAVFERDELRKLYVTRLAHMEIVGELKDVLSQRDEARKELHHIKVDDAIVIDRLIKERDEARAELAATAKRLGIAVSALMEGAQERGITAWDCRDVLAKINETT